MNITANDGKENIEAGNYGSGELEIGNEERLETTPRSPFPNKDGTEGKVFYENLRLFRLTSYSLSLPIIRS